MCLQPFQLIEFRPLLRLILEWQWNLTPAAFLGSEQTCRQRYRHDFGHLQISWVKDARFTLWRGNSHAKNKSVAFVWAWNKIIFSRNAMNLSPTTDLTDTSVVGLLMWDLMKRIPIQRRLSSKQNWPPSYGWKQTSSVVYLLIGVPITWHCLEESGDRQFHDTKRPTLIFLEKGAHKV